MVETSDATDLFNLLLCASQSALTSGHYETAYHALAAAMHYAQDKRDCDRLDEVVREAEKQLLHVDITSSGNVMSSFAAARRPSGVNLYKNLARNAAARAQMVKSTKRRPTVTL
jgi:hypothetical protein